MTLIRPRFIALDSSQLGDLARDSQAGDRSRHDAAGDFLSSFAANGCVLLLCWHHFEELLRHRNRDVVGKRISFFRSLDFVAWIKSARDDDPSPGGIVDILAFEADQAFKDAKADPVANRDRVLPNLIRCGDAVRWMTCMAGFRPWRAYLGRTFGSAATEEFQNRQRSLRNFLLAFANEPKRARSKGITSARRRYCPSISSDRRSARTRRSTRWRTCLPFGCACGSPMNTSERPGRNSNGA